MTPPAPLAAPFFSGGTGRSGTTIIANLLDRHPDLARARPWEARFLTDRFGLCDLVDARSTWRPRRAVDVLRSGNVRVFERKLRGPWFRRVAGNGKVVGLHQWIDEATLEAGLDGFRQRLRADPRGAAARLTHDLLDPPVRVQGKPRWMDTTPANAARADSLVRIFPDMRMVHMIRDGRDVAASVAARYWGPDDIDEALTWWEERMARSGRALARVPAQQVLTVQLEDLVLRRREETLHEVLAFLGLSPAEAVIAFHAERMQAHHANVSRWDAGMDAARRAEFTRRYEAALARLSAAGVPVPT